MLKRLLPHLALSLAAAQVLLMLGSWLYSAAYPMSGVRSLLSGEGLRWFFGQFATVVASPLLVDIVLLSVAYGVVRHSGVRWPFGRRHTALGYRERRAWLLGAGVLLLCVAVVVLLSAVPHAVLLSANGQLFPSPFSRSIVPVVAFTLCLSGITFGIVSGAYQRQADIYQSLLSGISSGASCILFCILLTQIYYSLRFVVG